MPAPSAKTSKAKAEPAAETRQLSVSYDGKAALERVTVAIPRSQITAVIGPNGSGKTTFIRALLGLAEPSHGEALIFGLPPTKAAERIGYVPQRFAMAADLPITVEEFLDLARRRGTPAKHIMHSLREVELPPRIAERQLSELSGGQFQRVLIAAAILNSPELLILDEAESAIDVAGEAAYYALLRHLCEEHGTTIILVSHDIAAIADAVDYVVCLNRTLLSAGPPEKALTADALQKLFGSRSNIHGHRHDL